VSSNSDVDLALRHSDRFRHRRALFDYAQSGRGQFWIVRAQGLVYGYFNFLNIARYPDAIFPRLFKIIFGWIIPVVIVANIPARLLIKSFGQPGRSCFSS